MKKIKIISVLFFATLLFGTIFTSLVFASEIQYDEGNLYIADNNSKLGNGFQYGDVPTDQGNSAGQVNKVNNIFNRMWNSAILVARIAAFTGIFILGLSYIFANADKKADLKKSLVPVIIGIVIFFGATFVIDFVKTVFEQLRNSM